MQQHNTCMSEGLSTISFNQCTDGIFYQFKSQFLDYELDYKEV